MQFQIVLMKECQKKILKKYPFGAILGTTSVRILEKKNSLKIPIGTSGEHPTRISNEQCTYEGAAKLEEF